MKAKLVIFGDLLEKTLFITIAVSADHEVKHCCVCQKVGSTSAKRYGSEEILPVHHLQKVIEVAETSYNELPTGSEFILAAKVLDTKGFFSPTAILLKLASYAHYFDINRKEPERDVQINEEERVFNLGCPVPFVFENITVVHLNI